ncbi:hypothetical protein TorRG33x02_169310, partial [Trema orientale]
GRKLPLTLCGSATALDHQSSPPKIPTPTTPSSSSSVQVAFSSCLLLPYSLSSVCCLRLVPSSRAPVL